MSTNIVMKTTNKKRKHNAKDGGVNGLSQNIKRTRLASENGDENLESSDEEGVLDLLEQEYQQKHPKEKDYGSEEEDVASNVEMEDMEIDNTEMANISKLE